jgi:hypothetical protein
MSTCLLSQSTVAGKRQCARAHVVSISFFPPSFSRFHWSSVAKSIAVNTTTPTRLDIKVELDWDYGYLSVWKSANVVPAGKVIVGGANGECNYSVVLKTVSPLLVAGTTTPSQGSMV